MADTKNHGFDVISEVDLHEMHNAVVQAQREIAVRFDFRGTAAKIDFDKKAAKLTLYADDKNQLETVLLVLRTKMAGRKVPVKSLQRGKVEDATHKSVREELTLRTGIEKLAAQKMIKEIKAMGLRVQAQIMDQKLRVTGKNKDDLQAVIAHFRRTETELPLQFTNFT